MIETKDDLKFFLESDKKALGYSNLKCPRPFIDNVWRYEIILRKTEYYTNVNTKWGGGIMRLLYSYRLKLLQEKMGVYIPINVFGPGLSIAHATAIVVNGASRIGANCRIHECVTIGATNGQSVAAHIGDNCFIGSGAKIIGNITLGDNVAIGAGAVVVKSVDEDSVTLAGVPAKIVSNNGSFSNIRRNI